MYLTRKYNNKLFKYPTFDYEKKIENKWYRFRRTPYIDHGIPVGKVQHYVLESDYDNWAIIYGCSQFLGIFYGSYSTLLSRKPILDYRYVR